MRQKIKVIHIHRALIGLPLPATRKTIIEYVRAKTASDGILNIMNYLPQKKYHNESQIFEALSIPERIRSRGMRESKTISIPHDLPQFVDDNALIVVAGQQEAQLYRVHDGVLEPLDNIKVPKPHYSDREGHFKVRSQGGVVRSGAPRELQDEDIAFSFLHELKKDLKSIRAEAYSKVYLFSPSYVKNQLIRAVPIQLKGKIVKIIEGNYYKHHPLTILRKLKKLRTYKIMPNKAEAGKILKNAEQARAVIRSKS